MTGRLPKAGPSGCLWVRASGFKRLVAFRGLGWLRVFQSLGLRFCLRV